MLVAQKSALENAVRQRLVGIRERELEYYTKNCRMLGDLASLVAGFAYSGIRYHYLLERQHSWMIQEGDALEEVVFLSLLTITLGCGLQTVLIAMLVAMLGPSLALRGPDDSLHDAVNGMQVWNSLMLALFMTSLVMLQMSALSFIFGHGQLGIYCRLSLSATILSTVGLTFRYSRIVMRKFRLPPEATVSGAFFDEHGQLQSGSSQQQHLQRPRATGLAATLRSRFGVGSREKHERHETVGLLRSRQSAPAGQRHFGSADHDELDEVLDETLQLASDALLGSGESRCAADKRARVGPLAVRLAKLMFGGRLSSSEAAVPPPLAQGRTAPSSDVCDGQC